MCECFLRDLHSKRTVLVFAVHSWRQLLSYSRGHDHDLFTKVGQAGAKWGRGGRRDVFAFIYGIRTDLTSHLTF